MGKLRIPEVNLPEVLQLVNSKTRTKPPHVSDFISSALTSGPVGMHSYLLTVARTEQALQRCVYR